ncbi:MAG: Dihydrolipoyllysine-residue acetyltransferase component of pyruvate dehydrogenase complex [Candidatus Heimdallarchaeota archaeon LC_2]|nr:MAG: Dihydrolipoyllysine-residue acetyltransferase component of pyruvate dehydrogenase complex [Candidatus Heimdallarchaeota archaeon LC_2]
MIYELKFADIGEGVHEGEILEWHVNVGDVITVEQLLLEVNTEKVNAEITSPVAGKVVSLEFKEGDIIKVGQILITIDTAGEGEPKTTIPKKEDAKETVKEKDDSLFTPSTPFKRIAKTSTSSKSVSKRVLAAPAVRRQARDAGIDLKLVPGSGPAGRITREDLASYLSGSPKARMTTSPLPEKRKLDIIPGGETRIPLKGIRRTIFNSMRKSKDTAAHYTYFDEVNMGALRDLRNQLKPLMEQRNIKISYPAIVMKCMIPALRKYPILNSSFDEENQEIIVKDYFNIGISVDTDDGLLVPVIKNVEQKSLWDISLEILEVADRARRGKLTLDDVSGGTLTLTSVGNIGGIMATPIIKSPEVAILGLTKSRLKPIIVEKNGGPEVGIGYMMNLSLSLDHRIVDGAVGARFMSELIRYMENPALLWAENTESV